MICSVSIRPMLEPDLLAYKALRDAMLSSHPEAFTSDAETERLRDLSSYRSAWRVARAAPRCSRCWRWTAAVSSAR